MTTSVIFMESLVLSGSRERKDTVRLPISLLEGVYKKSRKKTHVYGYAYIDI